MKQRKRVEERSGVKLSKEGEGGREIVRGERGERERRQTERRQRVKLEVNPHLYR